ncbi:MAG: hypothetical protein AB1742_03590 [bacterium]
MEELRQCRSCGKPAEPGEEFCTGCGAAFPKKRVRARRGGAGGAGAAPPLPEVSAASKFALVGFFIGFTLFYIPFLIFFYNLVHPAIAGAGAGAALSASGFVAGKILEKKKPEVLKKIDGAFPVFPRYGFTGRALNVIYTRFPSLKKHR